jgi:gliding motility-associated-like protein
VQPGDYSSTTGTLTFAGNSGETHTITVPTIDDNLLETTENYVVNLSGVSNTLVTYEAQGAGTITDNDAASLAIDDVTVDEGVGTATFTVTLSGNVQDQFNVNYATSDNGSALEGSDYIASSGFITFPANSTDGAIQTFLISITDDVTVESTETYTATLTGISGGLVTVSDDTALGSILDNDVSSVSIVATSQAMEPATNGVFTVSLSNPVSIDTKISYTVSGIAISGVDFVSLSGTVTIPANTLTSTIVVQVIDDSTIEKDESVIINLSNTNNVVTVVSTGYAAELNISDNDVASITINSVSTEEDNLSGEVTFKVTLTGILQDAFSIDYATIDGTATLADNDYVSGSGTLIFNPGINSRTISVVVNPDKKVELDETFTVGLSKPTTNGRNITVDNSGTGTIQNDDYAPVVVDINKAGPEDKQVIFLNTDFISAYTDADSDPMVSIKIVSLPSNGTLYVGSIPITTGQLIPVAQFGNITFHPSSDWFGITTFNYNAIDGTNWAIVDARVIITITSVNDDPVAVDDFTSTPEDTPVSGSVTINDTDLDGDNLTVTQFAINGLTYSAGSTVTIPTIGTLLIKTDGSFTFTPASNFNGIVPTVSFTISDGNGGADVGDLFISVNNDNDQPVIFDENLVVCSSDVLTGNILSNGDVDPDGTTLTVNTTPLSGPSHGTFSISDNGRFTYTPKLGYNGPDQITLSVCDNGTPLPSACSNDIIHIEVIDAVVAEAGADATVSEGSEYLLSAATVVNSTSQEWTTSGTGTFNNASLINPIYTPSINDIEAGSVKLKLTAKGTSPCGEASDFVNLTFSLKLTVYAGENAALCGGSSYKLSTASVANAGQIVWSTSGTGTFDNKNLVDATYTPSAADLESGQVILTITGFYQTTNGSVSDSMILSFSNKPFVAAGPDKTVCSGEMVSLDQVSAQNFTSIKWTTTGKGELSGTNTLAPTYRPASNESGDVEMIVTVSGVGNCDGLSASDTVVVRYYEIPEVDAGNDDTVLNNMTVVLSAAAYPSSENFTYSWSPAASVLLPNSSTTETVALLTNTRFVVTITNIVTGCQANDSVTIIVESDVDKLLNIRNGISPNGDGDNDIWWIDGIEKFKENEVQIFNRWGDKIIELHNYDNDQVVWDGMNRKGNRVPDGTYYYLIEIPNVKSYTGWIQLRSGRY